MGHQPRGKDVESRGLQAREDGDLPGGRLSPYSDLVRYWGLAAKPRPRSIALTFSGATRNSLGVLRLALALPEPYRSQRSSW